MMAMMKTVDLLGRERLVVARERARGMYGAAEYMLAKFVTELPLDALFAAGFGALLHWRIALHLPSGALVGILALTAASSAGLGLAVGACSASSDSALAVGIAVMVVYMVLGIINPAGAAAKPPSAFIRWLSHLSPIKWSIRALCCAELRGLKLEKGSLSDTPRMGALALVTSGEQVLERLGLSEESAAKACRRLGHVLVAQLAVAVIGLQWRRPKFQPMAPPVSMAREEA